MIATGVVWSWAHVALIVASFPIGVVLPLVSPRGGLPERRRRPADREV